MSRLSAGERKRLIDIMKCDRSDGYDTLKRELEQEKDTLTTAPRESIKNIDDKISKLEGDRRKLEREMKSMIEAAELDNISGYACGETHPRIREYKMETNRLERDILLSDSK